MWGLLGYKTEQKEVKTGFMGDTSPEQDKCLAQLKEHLTAIKGPEILEKFDDYYLLRFCRARNFVFADVIKMFGDFLTWREEIKIDELCETYEYPEQEAMDMAYPRKYHGVCKSGQSLFLECPGIAKDPEEIFQIVTEDRFIKKLIVDMEFNLNLRQPACSEVAGKHIEQGIIVSDLAGFRLS